jgi:toxin-antitoxin system PIN domain toxin
VTELASTEALGAKRLTSRTSECQQILVDVNVLVHAVNRDAPRHERALSWWDDRLSDVEPVCLAWVTLLGFARITTNPRIVPKPLSLEAAGAYISSWLDQPCVRILEPLDGHWARVEGLLKAAGTAGTLTTDAHLAALALEHGCEICSTDADFRRFADIPWSNPLAGLPWRALRRKKT